MATTATPTETATLVDYRVEDGLAIIELNDPPANTYTYEMMRQLDAAILEARMEDSAHVIVLRGSGEKFFSAGANIGMLNTVTPRFKYFFCLHANETLNRLEQTLASGYIFRVHQMGRRRSTVGRAEFLGRLKTVTRSEGCFDDDPQLDVPSFLADSKQ